MAGGEFGLHVGDGEAHLLVENEEVIDQVAGLVEVALAIAVDCLDNCLDSLFTDFLRDFVHALSEEVGGV